MIIIECVYSLYGQAAVLRSRGGPARGALVELRAAFLVELRGRCDAKVRNGDLASFIKSVLWCQRLIENSHLEFT